MMPGNDFFAMFDSYGRQARLFPGLLTLFPALLAVFAVYPWLLVANIAGTLLTISMSCGLLYALASYARTKGKHIEPKLLEKWGGWPTTHLLRHMGPLDSVTLNRYHRFLERSIEGLTFPSKEHELAHPAEADQIYGSAVTWIKEQTRSKEYSLVHRENTQYGFRRNLLGLKRVGLLASFASVLALVFELLVLLPASASWSESVKVALDWWAMAPTGTKGAIAANLIAALLWLTMVKETWVRQAADQYARALLAYCDAPKAPASGRAE